MGLPSRVFPSVQIEYVFKYINVCSFKALQLNTDSLQLPKMPHSISPDHSSDEDIVLPDAPEENPVDEEHKADLPSERHSTKVKLEDMFLSDDEDYGDIPDSTLESAEMGEKVEDSSPPPSSM